MTTLKNTLELKKEILISDYEAELENLEFMKEDGEIAVSTEQFNFIGEFDEKQPKRMDINVVINHVKDIIFRIKKVKTDLELEYFNY